MKEDDKRERLLILTKRRFLDPRPFVLGRANNTNNNTSKTLWMMLASIGTQRKEHLTLAYFLH